MASFGQRPIHLLIPQRPVPLGFSPDLVRNTLTVWADVWSVPPTKTLTVLVNFVVVFMERRADEVAS
jgi:hypothetical protein